MLRVQIGITPCDIVQIPVYFTRRTVNGIAADKQMFRTSGIVILRYVEDDGRNRDILVSAPGVYHDGLNYWDTDARRWLYD